MEGLLCHNGKEWIVKYCNIGDKELPLYYKDAEDVDKIVTTKFKKTVEFDIIDEFSHPHLFEDVSWGEGSYCAKLK